MRTGFAARSIARPFASGNAATGRRAPRASSSSIGNVPIDRDRRLVVVSNRTTLELNLRTPVVAGAEAAVP